MIRKRYDIDQWFFIRMNFSDHFYRFVDQFAFAIDFDLMLRGLSDFFDFPLKWLSAWQGSVISLDRGNGKTVIVISQPPRPRNGQMKAAD